MKWQNEEKKLPDLLNRNEAKRQKQGKGKNREAKSINSIICFGSHNQLTAHMVAKIFRNLTENISINFFGLMILMIY